MRGRSALWWPPSSGLRRGDLRRVPQVAKPDTPAAPLIRRILERAATAARMRARATPRTPPPWPAIRFDLHRLLLADTRV